MHPFRIAAIAVAACALTWTHAHAQSNSVPCNFVSESDLTPLRTAGASGALAATGSVAVAGAMVPYETTFTVDVGVWVDDAFLRTTPDAAALALRYFEHANCVFATGRNAATGAGVNLMSLRLADQRIRYYDSKTPNLPGAMAPWGLQYHWDWYQAMQAMPDAPAVNLLFTTGGIVELDGSSPGGLANGVGQGNGIVSLNPAELTNATKPNNLDWWGITAAHELTHALGDGTHTTNLYETMCCADPQGYALPGAFPSKQVALSTVSWNKILSNDLDWLDNYADPYAWPLPNPITGTFWSYPQISSFLEDRNGADVFVATSIGSSFLSRTLRHDWFCLTGEVCLTGDFDGDLADDLVAFTRGTTGDVFVSLSSGRGFAGFGVKWHDWFAINSETPLVGDFNGDGLDDIATVTGGSAADVYVALSTGHSFGPGVKWHDNFAGGTALPLVGYFDADNRADLVSFARGTSGDVHVALSTGTSFGPKTLWHAFFCINSEVPLVGNFGGDGRDDIATFTRGTSADVYVALSTGTSFSGTGQKWHDYFAAGAEIPVAGDVNYDGFDDVIAFQRGTAGRVYVATSTGTGFAGTGILWTSNLCLGDDTCAIADVTGDLRADAIAFHRD